MADTIEIGKRIKYARELKGMTQEELGKELGMNKSSIMRYEKGIVDKIKLPVIEAMANVLSVNPSWLSAKSEDMDIKYSISGFKNIIPIRKVRYIPVIGRIACGTPILAQENHTDNIVLPDSVDADFALICEGDSMINAKIDDGDTVYIHIQPEVENGEIAAVRIDDEVTLKKVFLSKDLLKLVPANDEYEPFVYSSQEAKEKNITIIGKAVAILKAI